MSERCGYQWPTDCPRVERRTDEAWQTACCARPVADGASRCSLHAPEVAPEDSAVAALSGEPGTPRGRLGPFTELLDGASLAGCSLSGASLAGTALRGADLRGATLADTDLRGASLREADLRDATLDGADLTDATLRSADLRGASLEGADLTDANLRAADLGE